MSELILKRCVLYLRVSTKDQNHDLQRKELTEYAHHRGWRIEKVYEEKLTGTNGNRPELKALVKDSRARKFDIVLCWKLDRWFRSLKEIISTLQEFTELGIEFVSLKDNIDVTTSSGKLMMHIIGAFAEWEVSILKERVRSGLMAAKARGQVLGRPQLINPEITEEVMRLRKAGLSIRGIERSMNKRISKTSIERVLRLNGCTKKDVRR